MTAAEYAMSSIAWDCSPAIETPSNIGGNGIQRCVAMPAMRPFEASMLCDILIERDYWLLSRPPVPMFSVDNQGNLRTWSLLSNG